MRIWIVGFDTHNQRGLSYFIWIDCSLDLSLPAGFSQWGDSTNCCPQKDSHTSQISNYVTSGKIITKVCPSIIHQAAAQITFLYKDVSESCFKLRVTHWSFIQLNFFFNFFFNLFTFFVSVISRWRFIWSISMLLLTYSMIESHW